MDRIYIRNGNHSAGISAVGAENFSHIINGKEQMFLGLLYGKGGASSYGRTSPDMFPTPGPTGLPKISEDSRKSKYTFNGSEYQTEQHGFIRGMTFEELPGRSNNSVDLVARSNEETKKEYPFDFEYHVHYHLTKSGDLFREVTVLNTGKTPMVFARGDHPCYKLDGKLGEYSVEFTDVTNVENEEDFGEDVVHSGFEFNVPSDLADVGTQKFQGIAEAKLVLKRAGKPVKAVVLQGPSIWIWTPAKEGNLPFIALESVQGTSANPTKIPSKLHGKDLQSIEEVDGAIILPAGGSFYSSYIMLGSPERKASDVYREVFDPESKSTRFTNEEFER